MKIVQTSDYLIYFDNVRVDPYVVNWNTMLGLSPGQASGSVTMYLSPSMLKWKAYLTQVRIFAKNIFTGKYTMVFDGEIATRNWNDSRGDSGKVTYPIEGYYHWFEIPIPLHIGQSDELESETRFRYEAQGINYQAISRLFTTEEEITMKDKNIQEVVNYLFDKMNQGYYDAAGSNSTFSWARLKERMQVMADIIKDFRTSGLFDMFTMISKTQIQTFYVYLNQILSQMMFEFYQDRDGSLRIKNPSWKDQILKNHILDESVVANISGSDGWNQEPTRVLVVGGVDPLFDQSSAEANKIIRTDIVPIGLYVADAIKGHYYDGSSNFETLRTKYGIDGSEVLALAEGEISTADWFDNLTGKYSVTSPFTGGQARTDVSGNTAPHRGTDYGIPFSTQLRNIGASGTVTALVSDPGGGGNILEITETIGNVSYLFKYMHLFKYQVNKGDVVKPGTPIALSGGKRGTPGAGNATGPHLHLEIWNLKENKPIDPDAFLKQAKDEIVAQQIAKKAEATSVVAPIDSGFVAQMATIQPFSGSITAAASGAGVMSEVASAYLATLYALDDRDATTKGLDYGNVNYLGTKISFLAGYTTDDTDAMKQAITLKDGVDAADQTIDLLGKIIDNQLATTDFSNDKAYNAFSTTDNVKAPSSARKFSVFNTNPIAAIQPQSAIAAKTDWMDFVATAYIATCEGCTGVTYTGKDVSDTSKEYRVIAVDPTVIPLHSLVEIDGPGGVSGTYDALDIGGAIKGRHIDILMSTQNAALKFGKQQIRLRVIRWGQGTSEATNPRSMTYASTNDLVYQIPSRGADFQDAIVANSGHIDPNLICALIDVASSWRPKYGVDHIGLLGIPKNYIDTLGAAGAGVDFKDGNNSIHFGSDFLAHCLDTLNNQPTLALAAYYLGDPELVDAKVRLNVKSFNFVDVRPFLDASATKFVDDVLGVYLTLFQADYIQGDPHKSFDLTSTSDGNFVDDQSSSAPSLASNKFGIGLSDEELRFKMNLSIFTQQLLRYGTNIAGANRRNVQEIVQRYAIYMMQVSRAAAHVVQVNHAVCMPFLRPGFNTWIEPSRKNIVAYITSVSHQGAYAQGCFTSINAEFVRTANTYDDIQETVFLGEMHAKASDFGDVIPKEEMDSLRNRLLEIHANDIADDASNVDILRELYNADHASDSTYVTEWNAEYTADEVEERINTLYSSAPSIVIQRTREIAQVMSESEDFFVNKLLVEFGR